MQRLKNEGNRANGGNAFSRIRVAMAEGIVLAGAAGLMACASTSENREVMRHQEEAETSVFAQAPLRESYVILLPDEDWRVAKAAVMSYGPPSKAAPVASVPAEAGERQPAGDGGSAAASLMEESRDAIHESYEAIKGFVVSQNEIYGNAEAVPNAALIFEYFDASQGAVWRVVPGCENVPATRREDIAASPDSAPLPLYFGECDVSRVERASGRLTVRVTYWPSAEERIAQSSATLEF